VLDGNSVLKFYFCISENKTAIFCKNFKHR
jgi:hypothetical protein